MVYTDGTHLIADNEAELHAFARKIGLKPEWFQNHRIPHYDLMGCKVSRALKEGAVLKDKREIVRIINA